MSATFSKNIFDVLGDDDEPRQPVAPVKETPAQSKPANNKPAAPAGKENGARGAGRGGRRGGRQQQNGRPQRGRQFDRHSATGLVDSEKKVTQAWGHPETAEAEAAKDNATTKEVEEKEAAEPVEPEEKVKTLDEYKAELAAKQKAALPEARKPNEGAEDKWKDAVTLQKADEPEYFTPKTAKAAKKASEKTRKEKVVIEIEQRFQEKPRANFRGNNERRGGERRGRGRNSGRRGDRQSSTPAVNIQDDALFPSLGA